ncbi:MAG: hypothetical protein ACREBH_04420 [Candidatus Micrarchaeaceae archaeon]
MPLKKTRSPSGKSAGTAVLMMQLAQIPKRRLVAAIMAVVIVVLAIVTLAVRATSSSGFEACKSIVLPQQRDQCFYAFANNTDNYSLCSNIGPSQLSYSCIGAIAKRERDADACGMINSSSYLYDSCIENVSYSTGDASYCMRIDGANESLCAYGVADANGFDSISYCSYIDNGSDRNLCSYIYYYGRASYLGMQSYCSMLPNVTNSTVTDALLAKSHPGQTTSFNYISYGELNMTPRDYCYYSAAMSTNNMSLCSMAGSTLGQLCTSSLAAGTNSSLNSSLNITNVSMLCSNAPSYIQSLCLYTVYTEQAVAEKNASVCASIGNATYQDTCITQLATSYNDSAYCSYINDSESAQIACEESASSSLPK